MQDGTYPPRNFATLGPSELQPPFTETYTQCFHTLFLLNGTGQVSNPIHHIAILQSSVFLINSRSSLVFFVFQRKTLLLPKLQSHFAEFLKCCYPNHLSVLNQPPCIGLVRFYNFLALTVFGSSNHRGTPSSSPLGTGSRHAVYLFAANLRLSVILFTIFLVTHANIVTLQ